MTKIKLNAGGGRHIVDIIGDSHTAFFKTDLMRARRSGILRRLRFSPRVTQVNAASLTGVRKYASTLRLKGTIEDRAKAASHLVIALGQVDLELGYYHRLVTKQETWTQAEFIEFLAEIYRGLLEGIRHGSCQIALKGVNLTVLTTPLFTRKYLSRILTENDPESRAAAEGKLASLLPSEADQNAFHLAFNRRVAALADSLGLRYFDINDEIAQRDGAGRVTKPMRLCMAHQPLQFDHHLAPTLQVHRAHLDALQRIFP